MQIRSKKLLIVTNLKYEKDDLTELVKLKNKGKKDFEKNKKMWLNYNKVFSRFCSDIF